MLYGRFAITMSYHKKINAVAVNYGIVKKCAVEENPKSEIDRYQAA